MAVKTRTFGASDEEFAAYKEVAKRLDMSFSGWVRAVCNRAVDAILGQHVLDGRQQTRGQIAKLAPPCDHVEVGEMCKRCGEVRE